jgi:hypothetical protein
VHEPADPGGAGGVGEGVGALDVGLEEDVGVEERPVDVGFGREVDDRVHPREGAPDRGGVADVPADEAVARGAAGLAQVGEVAGVGQLVERDHAVPRVRVAKSVPHEMGADETGPARHEQFHSSSPRFSRAG